MQCEVYPAGETQKFFHRFYTKVEQHRIPVLGAIELTDRCNLNCVHCYLSSSIRKGRAYDHRPGPDRSEISTQKCLSLIDQIADAGCLYLVFTGGEVMARRDFCEIYQHACRKGILVTVFTNATLLNDRVYDAFDETPPYCIEISLYGATEKTYEKVTGVPGSFKKCMNNIFRLKSRGFWLKLKTMLLSVNIDELGAIKNFASKIGVSFRFDGMIFPRFDGDTSPLNYRLKPQDVVKKEFLDEALPEQLSDLYHRMRRIKPSSKLYQCGAGINMFHIDARGMMRPCMMVFDESFDLNEKSFAEAWYSEEFRNFSSEKEIPVLCKECDKRSLCGYCPGFFKLESGDERVPSEYLCDIGHEREQAVLSLHLEKSEI